MPVIPSIILSLAVASAQAQAPDFDRKVRPILADKCFACHGPDKDGRKGKLRLDKRDRILGISGGDAVVVPGDREESELWYRITADYADDLMPPVDHGKSLSAAEIEILGKWIDDGAPWAEHWAFVSPVKPELPDVVNREWSRTGLDRFVLAELEKNGKQPNHETAKGKWLRRTSLALTGLPPTEKELQAFVADTSAAAYQKVVDRLFAAPAYGEHMASAWLDGARYADTNGYQNDFHRAQWPWRDWVVQAYNKNLPFDQFATWQLAGDLLPNATNEQILATGFGRNHRTVTEAGSLDEEWRVENVVDRVETTSTVFMGLTMGCARCHDHRYDPVTQKEFYSFYGFFNSQDERGVYQETRGNAGPVVRVPSAGDQGRLAELRKAMKDAEGAHADAKADRKVEFENWKFTLERQSLSNNDSWVDIVRLERKEDPRPDLGNEIFSPEQNDSFYISAWVRPRSEGTVIGKMDAEAAYRGVDLTLIEGRKISVHLIHNWPNNAIKVVSHEPLEAGTWSHVAASYDGSGKASGVQLFLNGEAVPARVASDTLNGSILTETPLRLGQRSTREHLRGDIHSARFEKTTADEAKVRMQVNADAHGLWRRLRNPSPKDEEQGVAESEGSASQGDGLSEQDLEQVFASCFHPASREARVALQNKTKALADFEKNIPSVMVMKDRAEPRPTYLLNRGLYDQPVTSEALQTGVPEILPGWEPSFPRNRLGLAQWMVSSKNPLTSRVAVNRIWQQLFGVGLVKTSENFGIQGSRPSHPQLLDWLAMEFVESGWDVQAMQKRMVLSATFRQSSSADVQSYADDPDNLQLARGPRYRLSAEQVRDQALMASGLLVQQLGGPPTRPHQPPGLWSELAGGAGQGPYVQDTNAGLWRRSLYTHRKRSVPHPTLTTFDAPSFETCLVRRPRTNTPLQALATLNDPTYVEAARHLGGRMMSLDGSDAQRLTWAFSLLTCRPPTETEQAVLKDALYAELRYTPKDPAAAWTAVAAILLNLDEVLNCD
jgi:hypothetical protein